MAGLDLPAVFATAEVLGIEMTPAMLRKVKALEIEGLRKQKKGGVSPEEQN